MAVIVSDPRLSEQLQTVSDCAELRDATGRLLGFFIPLMISREELDRRAAEPGGRPLADILRDLESRA